MLTTRSPLRLVRGAAAASLATGVALGGHLVGGGAMPSLLGVALPWWLSVAACTVLAGSRFSVPRMGVAVVSSQALFHGLFLAGTPADHSVQLVAPPGSHLGHSAHAAPPTSTESLGVAAGHALHGSGSDLRMMLWHLVAALVTTVLLQRGESMLLRCFGLAGCVLAFLRRPLDAITAPQPVLPRTARHLPPAHHLGHARRAVLSPQRRRGPPPALAA